MPNVSTRPPSAYGDADLIESFIAQALAGRASFAQVLAVLTIAEAHARRSAARYETAR